MKIVILAVGKLKEKYLKEGISEYSKRLSRFCDLEFVEVEDEQAPDNMSVAQEEIVKKKEADKIIKRVKDGSFVILMDVKGTRLDSEEFSKKISGLMTTGKSHITFIIGGSLGVDEEIRRLADFRLTVSDMTFPHQLLRLILLEQVFRAFKIMNGETYHK